MRFGIVHVDFESLVRTPKSSGLWYSRLIQSTGCAMTARSPSWAGSSAPARAKSAITSDGYVPCGSSTGSRSGSGSIPSCTARTRPT
nr:family 1 glycosylhydrolase [Parafrankia sp. Ea1.12]